MKRISLLPLLIILTYLLFATLNLLGAQVNQFEDGYLKDWLVLSDFSDVELDISSMKTPKAGDKIKDSYGKEKEWQTLKSDYPNINLAHFYSQGTRSAIYLFSQIASSKEAIIYIAAFGLKPQDQIWVDGKQLDSLRISDDRNHFPLKITLKKGLTSVWCVTTSSSVKISLQESSRHTVIQGQVFYKNNRIVEEAEIKLQINDQTIRGTKTDHQGEYVVLLEKGDKRVNLSAHKKDEGTWVLGQAVNKSQTIDVTIEPAISITGALLDYSNRPHPYSIVEAQQVDCSPNSGKYREPLVIKTDADGEYNFVNLKPGLYYLRAHLSDRYIHISSSKRQKNRVSS